MRMSKYKKIQIWNYTNIYVEKYKRKNIKITNI